MTDPASKEPNYTVSYEPVKAFMRIIWAGLVTEAELYQGYEAALDILKHNPVTRILIDNLERRLEPGLNPEPAFEHLFNQALKLISNTLFLALVLPPEEFYLTDENSRYCEYEQSVNDFVILERFLSRAEAETWLNLIS